MEVLNDVAFALSMVIITLMISFFAIPFFIIACCCMKKKQLSASQKVLFFITVGILVAFAAFFWSMVGFIATIDSDYDQVNCVIAKLPNDVLNGSTDERFPFIGLLGFRNMLNNLQSEISQIPTIAGQLESIKAKGLDQYATSAASSIKNFAT